MPRFTQTLNSWNTPHCKPILKRELEGLEAGALPLHLGTTQGGVVDDSPITVTVFGMSENGISVRASVGVFFSEIVGGCSCGDEPLAEPAYCRLLVTIDKGSAEVSFEMVADDS